MDNFTPGGRKFRTLMRAVLPDELEYDPSKGRPVDYSFMYEPEQEQTERIVIRRRRLKRHATARTVAGVLIFCTAVVGTALWINSDQATAVKLKRIFRQLTNGLFTSETVENPDAYRDDSANIFKIETMADLDKAKKFLPELSVPQYIPGDYEFKSLEITKYITNGNYIVQYQYQKGSEQVNITMKTSMDTSSVGNSLRAAEVVIEGDLMMSVLDNKETNTHSVSAIKGNLAINVTGDVPAEEMLDIIRNLS